MTKIIFILVILSNQTPLDATGSVWAPIQVMAFKTRADCETQAKAISFPGASVACFTTMSPE